MNITDLTVAKKPARLKWSNIETKSKILLDICWSQLKGNRYPYLSVNILLVKDRGININDHNEQKTFIKNNHSEFYKILDNHLTNFNSFEPSHNVSNTKYWLKQLKKDLAEKPLTKQQLQDDINSLIDECVNKDLSFDGKYKSYKNKSLNIFINAYKPLQYVVNDFKQLFNDQWISDRSIKIVTENLLSFGDYSIYYKGYIVNEIVEMVQEYVKQINVLRKQLTQYTRYNRDIMTVEKFCSNTGLTESQTKDLFFLDNDQTDLFLNEFLKDKSLQAEKDLLELTRKYDLPVIYK